MDELDKLNEWAAHREQELAREAVEQARRDEMKLPPKSVCFTDFVILDDPHPQAR